MIRARIASLRGANEGAHSRFRATRRSLILFTYFEFNARPLSFKATLILAFGHTMQLNSTERSRTNKAPQLDGNNTQLNEATRPNPNEWWFTLFAMNNHFISSHLISFHFISSHSIWRQIQANDAFVVALVLAAFPCQPTILELALGPLGWCVQSVGVV